MRGQVHVRTAIVDHLGGPEAADVVGIGGGRRTDDLRTRTARELHGKPAHSAGRRVYERALTRLETAMLEQRLVSGQGRERHRCCLYAIEFRGGWRREGRLDGNIFGTCTEQTDHREHRLADREIGDLRADLRNDTRDIATRDGRQWNVDALADVSLADLPVDGIDTPRLRADQDLVVLRRGPRHDVDLQDLGATIVVEADRSHRFCHQRAPRDLPSPVSRWFAASQ